MVIIRSWSMELELKKYILKLSLLITGDYWIDPNEGSSYDAVLVHCNATNYETCVYAKQPEADKDMWFSGKPSFLWAFKDYMDEPERVSRFFKSYGKKISSRSV